MRQMPDSHIQQLLEYGVLTGSRAFNCSTKSSDGDIVILLKDLTFTSAYSYYSYTKSIQNSIIYHIHFIDMPTHVNTTNINEIEGDELEYDKMTIWGPITDLLKYKSPKSDQMVNLFIYDSQHKEILLMFRKVTHLMNFLHGDKLQDKPYRIEAFKHILKSVGITDLR